MFVVWIWCSFHWFHSSISSPKDGTFAPPTPTPSITNLTTLSKTELCSYFKTLDQLIQKHQPGVSETEETMWSSYNLYVVMPWFSESRLCWSLTSRSEGLKFKHVQEVAQSLIAQGCFKNNMFFCVKHKKIGGTWPFNPHWLIFLGRAGAMKDRNVPKPMEKKNLENQFKSLQLRRDLEMERTVFESSSRAVVSNPLQVDGNHRCHVVDYCIIWCDTMKTYLTYFPDKMSS